MKIPFTNEERRIVETEFYDQIEIIPTFTGEHAIKTQQYVGYIVLPNHVISITPKISGISFLNMVRYALKLPDLRPEYFEWDMEENYYDILVRFLLQELEKLLQRGIYKGYKQYEDNLTCIRGKILFKEHLAINHDRNDKVFCSFSEMSGSILENQIIKYTVFYLSKCYFMDDDINSQLLNYYGRLDDVDLVPITTELFKSIEYTPLNDHYRTILTLCELFLKDSSLDQEKIGEKTSISFLIDMNRLFEMFVSNLLAEYLYLYTIDPQKTEYPEQSGNRLRVRLDIKILRNSQPLLIIDTKYQKFSGTLDIDHVAQLALYSLSTGVKNCVLIYIGQMKRQYYLLKDNIKLQIISFDLVASDRHEFERKCQIFIQEVISLLNSLRT